MYAAAGCLSISSQVFEFHSPDLASAETTLFVKSGNARNKEL